jgi:hypothetical protein
MLDIETQAIKKKMERFVLKQNWPEPHLAAQDVDDDYDGGSDDDDYMYTTLILISVAYTFGFFSLADSQFRSPFYFLFIQSPYLSFSIIIHSLFLLFIFRPIFPPKSCYCSFHSRVKQTSLTRGHFTMDITLYSKVQERCP